MSGVYPVTHVRTDNVHCRDAAGTGPVVLKVVPVSGAASSGITMDQLMCAYIFPHPPLVQRVDMLMCDTQTISEERKIMELNLCALPWGRSIITTRASGLLI